MYKHFFKRLIDFFLALIGSIVLLPFFVIIGIIIFIDDPGPIFFRQKRVGKNKKLFTIWKFRTMKRNTPDIPTHLLEHPEQYITRTGKFWRKLSIDELPNIWSILIGKMALIGPRPALWNQDDLIAERDKYGANDIRPGLTGWAQINGRDELEIPIKAAFDGEYVKRMSFCFDLKCFFGTIRAVFKHDGVVEGGTGTMKKTDSERVDSIDAYMMMLQTDNKLESISCVAESSESNNIAEIVDPIKQESIDTPFDCNNNDNR